MIAVRVLFLGPARDFAQTDEALIDLPDGCSVGELKTLLADRQPGLRPGMSVIRFAVNESFTGDDHPLRDGDEIALIPPVSGGSDDARVHVALVTEPIAVDEVRRFVTGDPAYGGIVTFEGATRGESDPDHGELIHLEYEAYERMADKQLRLLADRAIERFSAGRVALVHRFGVVPPGEASVAIAVACGHRAEAFDACRYLIDELKRDVPIWKKDVFADGYVRWVRPTGAPDTAAPAEGGG